MPTNINMYKRIKTRSDTTCWSGFLKKKLFSDPFGKQNSGSIWYRIFKIFKTILNVSLGFIHIYFYGKNQILKLIIKCQNVTLTLL